MDEQKKTIFEKLFPKPRKALSNAQLEDLLKESHINLVARMNSLDEAVRKLLTEKEIPANWLEICRKLNERFPAISINDIYTILKGYKDMQGQKSETERLRENLATEKEAAEEKNIRNCYVCGKAVSEGNYYKAGDKVACLEHLEKKKERGKK